MSLALFNPGNDCEREAAFFRFTVRCDRDLNTRIERAAKKAGVSPTTFVQRHFDRILERDRKTFDATNFDILGFSKRHHVGVGAARLYALLRSEADAQGSFKKSLLQIADHFQMSTSLAGQYRTALVEIGLVKRVRSDKNGPEAWRVLEEA